MSCHLIEEPTANRTMPLKSFDCNGTRPEQLVIVLVPSTLYTTTSVIWCWYTFIVFPVQWSVLMSVILQLIVSFLGYPQPEVKWLQNEKPVSESSRVTVEQNEDGLCSLVLDDLEASDSGVYVCRASNKLGEAMCSAKLQVEMWLRGKPQEPHQWLKRFWMFGCILNFKSTRLLPKRN